MSLRKNLAVGAFGLASLVYGGEARAVFDDSTEPGRGSFESTNFNYASDSYHSSWLERLGRTDFPRACGEFFGSLAVYSMFAYLVLEGMERDKKIDSLLERLNKRRNDIKS